MNAVEYMARQLAPEAVRRLASLAVPRFAPAQLGESARPSPRLHALDTVAARACVIDRWGGDLCGLLNAMSRGELGALARELGVDHAPALRAAELRSLLWEAGARLERGDGDVGEAVQPRPIVLGGHLVVQAAPRGLYPQAPAWPRPIPPSVTATAPEDEPETLDDLLAAADRALGVRLGRRGRDKGAWGLRAAALLGIVERGHDEPDWRGDVEVKTVPVAVDSGTGHRPGGWWRVVEDPAIAMLGPAHDGARGDGVALAKLQRTLWLVRADLGDGDATIISWYLLESTPDVARLVRRYLHDRPKGPAGTDQRGLYLHKRFFAEAGLLATLNGPGVKHP
ncbi:MAG: hypothetical protein H0T89_15465 [Deltaproteobacteria bacterium]|nr:hypothetical protein [Deltaproteobacteria bacterium]